MDKKQELAIVEQLRINCHLPNSHIARYVSGVTVKDVERIRKENHLPRYGRFGGLFIKVGEMLRENPNITNADLANKLHCGTETVREYRRALGYPSHGRNLA